MISLATLSLVFFQSPLTIPRLNTPLDALHLVKPGLYQTAGKDAHAVWVVKGHDFSLDMTDRLLRGNQTAGSDQGQYEGIGILLDGCVNVTLKNADISGFRFNLVLRDCKNVRILSTKVNRSRSIRMAKEGKPVDTLLNLRDLDAWRTYGAGIWLERCTTCRVERCTASDAQNGIVLVDTSGSNVIDNECSTNGGWGLAVWHSERNTLAWNHADFCNRPWSGGWGGATAGIAVVNGAFSNQFIANSLTHCGDGFLLTDLLNEGIDSKTQEYTFDGASNLNCVAHNDGSWSSNNAFEGTCSEGNIYYANHAEDSNNGFWLGFSNQSFVIDNDILRNQTDGVAVQQGGGSTIFLNRIFGNHAVGVHIWSDAGPAELARPSIDNRVIQNQIMDSRLAVSLERSIRTLVQENTIRNAALPPGVDLSGLSLAQRLLLAGWKHSKVAKRLDDWFSQRPKGWLFYRETDNAKTPTTIKLGEFAPAR